MKRYLTSEGLNLVIAIPLTAQAHTLGVLMCGTRAVRTLTAEERSLLASIGQQVGMAVENARLYKLAEATAVVAERQRLGRELHDAVTQTLFSASLIADVLPQLSERNPAEGKRRLAELRDLTRGALAEMRTLLYELRPAALAEMSLGDLLRQLGEATKGRARVPVIVDAVNVCPLDPAVQVALYRIAQEALNNVAKYANATQVWVSLSCTQNEGEGQIVDLSVTDNGCGFDRTDLSPTGHLGFGIMEERAAGIGAHLSVESAPGKGTRIVVRWSESGRKGGVK
jgi:signal transduction histidine kinase